METEWRIARAQLRELLSETPQASHRQLADALGYSIGWVRKWRPQLMTSHPDDETILNSQAHRPKRIIQKVSPALEDHIIALRFNLSEQYHRKVGSRTIAAYLKRERLQDETVVTLSSTSIWRILRRRQMILVPEPPDKQPLVRPDPGQCWEIDFCTIARHSPEAPDKKENALEVFNVVDKGSSAHMDSQASVQFDAEHVLLSMAETLRLQGIPRSITYDRDPRFIGSQATDGFPSAFTRFLLCLGCVVDILPPHRPDLKPYVERFNRTQKVECFTQHPPTTSAEATAVAKT